MAETRSLDLVTTECRHTRVTMRNGVPTCVMCGEAIVTGRCRSCNAPLDDHDGLVRDAARCPSTRG